MKRKRKALGGSRTTLTIWTEIKESRGVSTPRALRGLSRLANACDLRKRINREQGRETVVRGPSQEHPVTPVIDVWEG